MSSLRRHGQPGCLFNKAWMQSAVHDLIRLGAAECGRRRKGSKTYDYDGVVDNECDVGRGWFVSVPLKDVNGEYDQ